MPLNQSGILFLSKDMISKVFYITLFMLCIFTNLFSVSQTELKKIAEQIWRNECNGTKDGLVSWNQQEEFISLGIGHFIWFPDTYNGPFTQTFPALKKFLLQKNVKLPAWLKDATHCPWNSRSKFLAESSSKKVKELKQLLYQTIDFQADFILQRFEQTFSKIMSSLNKKEKEHVVQQYKRIIQSTGGYYALIDYVNFKGEGTNPKERYSGRGWGLLQVLQSMKGSKSGPGALHEFIDAATTILEQRVQNSPSERNEQRWLPGWKKRLQTYKTFAELS